MGRCSPTQPRFHFPPVQRKWKSKLSSWDEHCPHTASTLQEVNDALVLLLPHPHSEHIWLLLGRKVGSCYTSQTHLRANKLSKTPKCPAQEREEFRSFFCGEVGLKLLLSGTGNFPPVLRKSNSSSDQPWKIKKKKRSRKWKALKVVAQTGNEESIIAPEMRWTSNNVKGQT